MGRNPKFHGLLGPDATPKKSGIRERVCGISSTRQDSLHNRTFLWLNPLIWIRNLVLHLIFPSEATYYRNPVGEIAKKRITGLLTLLESKEKASPEILSFKALHESGHPPLSIIVLHWALNSVFSLLNPKLKCFSFWFYLPICLLLKIQNCHKTLSSISIKVILTFFTLSFIAVERNF